MEVIWAKIQKIRDFDLMILNLRNSVIFNKNVEMIFQALNN